MDLDLPPPQAAPGAGNPVGREPGSGFSPDTEPAGTVIWNFQPLELRDMKACLCPPPGSGSLWQQPGWPEHGSRRLSGQYKPLLFFKSSGGCKQHHLGSGLVLSPLHCVPLRRARASLGLRVFICLLLFPLRCSRNTPNILNVNADFSLSCSAPSHHSG